MMQRVHTFMQDAADTSLGDLVTQVPDSSRVLLRHGLDFCCGGNQTLAAACKAKGLRLERIVSELHEVSDAPPPMDWHAAPLQSIITHILRVYHAPLPEELSQLESMAEKVLVTHGLKDPIRLPKIRDQISEFARELQFHMEKEELVLFPWIATHRHPPPGPPIGVMEAEHQQAAQSLAQLRVLTDNFTAPEGACMTWRNLYARLESFDHTLRAHIHLENHVLFPRALASN